MGDAAMIGRVLGSYRVERELGRGGMGQVYLAEHVKIGKRAAVKVLLPERAVDRSLVERFFNEARAAAGIRHPGMVEVFDFGIDDEGRSFLVMEWLDGESLADHLRRGPMALGRALDVLRQVVSAVGAAHALSIVHRDLKPDNLFLVPDAAVASGVRVKVLDFGIAKLGGEIAAGTESTASNVILGTPIYMAPEQCEGGRAIDGAADFYSLGAILFELTTGRPPFRSGGPGAILAAHLHEPPPRPRSLAPDLPVAVERLILALLAKHPEARPSAAELAATLDDLCAAHPAAPTSDVRAVIRGAASALDATALGTAPAIAGTDQAPIDALAATAAPRAAAATPSPAVVTPPPPAAQLRSRLRTAARYAVAGAIFLWALLWWWRSDRKETEAEHKDPVPAALARLSSADLERTCQKNDAKACNMLATRLLREEEEPAFDRAAAALHTACDGGLAAGCRRLGELHQVGQGVTLDIARAISLFEKACNAKDGDACLHLAFHTIAGYGRQFDPAAALELRLRGCALESVGACREAARQLEFGLGVDADVEQSKSLRERALALATAGCDAGDVEDCHVAGLIYFEGRHVPKDEVRASALLRRACDEGVGDACNDLGQVYLFGSGLTQDLVKGTRAIERSCARGSLNGCESLGILYANGFGVAQDGVRARKILEDLCQSHGPTYCGGLRSLYATGAGVTPDPVRDHELGERACLAGAGALCFSVARAYERGDRPVEKDEARAVMLYERGRVLGNAQSWIAFGADQSDRGEHAAARHSYQTACDLSDGLSCEPLATLYLEGDRSVVDPARGIELLERSCTYGSPTACHELGVRLRDGRGIKRDATRAFQSFISACDRSWGKACAAAAGLLDGKSGLTPEPERARTLRRRGCQLDVAVCASDAGKMARPPAPK